MGLLSPLAPGSYSSNLQQHGRYYAEGEQYFTTEVREQVCCLSEGGKIAEFSLHSEFPLGNSVTITFAVLDT